MKSPHLESLSRPHQWILLIFISGLLSWLFIKIHMPGALLLGPMLGGIIFSMNGGCLQISRRLFFAAQAIIGCLVAQSISGNIFHTFSQHWLLFICIVFSTMIASTGMGWLMGKFKVLPGTTAIWGSSPGAAAAMVLMAEEYGADARLVAFMQYLRVIIVASAASIIARFWVDTSAVSIAVDWFPPISWSLVGTLAIAASGILLARFLKIPSGAMLVPMLLGTVIQMNGIMNVALPEWLLGLAYAVMGWRIGLSFTRQVLQHALRALPQITLSIMLLISFCGALAWLLAHMFNLDPLTAYLATSPGGMDSIAIIAAASPNVDIEFVMSLQTVRLFLVILTGPPLARFIANKTAKVSSSSC